MISALALTLGRQAHSGHTLPGGVTNSTCCPAGHAGQLKIGQSTGGAVEVGGLTQVHDGQLVPVAVRVAVNPDEHPPQDYVGQAAGGVVNGTHCHVAQPADVTRVAVD